MLVICCCGTDDPQIRWLNIALILAFNGFYGAETETGRILLYLIGAQLEGGSWVTVPEGWFTHRSSR